MGARRYDLPLYLLGEITVGVLLNPSPLRKGKGVHYGRLPWPCLGRFLVHPSALPLVPLCVSQVLTVFT